MYIGGLPENTRQEDLQVRDQYIVPLIATHRYPSELLWKIGEYRSHRVEVGIPNSLIVFCIDLITQSWIWLCCTSLLLCVLLILKFVR